jgi:hypothetical protein
MSYLNSIDRSKLDAPYVSVVVASTRGVYWSRGVTMVEMMALSRKADVQSP